MKPIISILTLNLLLLSASAGKSPHKRPFQRVWRWNYKALPTSSATYVTVIPGTHRLFYTLTSDTPIIVRATQGRVTVSEAQGTKFSGWFADTPNSKSLSAQLSITSDTATSGTVTFQELENPKD